MDRRAPVEPDVGKGTRGCGQAVEISNCGMDACDRRQDFRCRRGVDQFGAGMTEQLFGTLPIAPRSGRSDRSHQGDIRGRGGERRLHRGDEQRRRTRSAATTRRFRRWSRRPRRATRPRRIWPRQVRRSGVRLAGRSAARSERPTAPALMRTHGRTSSSASVSRNSQTESRATDLAEEATASSRSINTASAAELTAFRIRSMRSPGT